VLVVAGLLAPAGTVALLLLAGNIQRLDLGRAAPAIKYSGELQE